MTDREILELLLKKTTMLEENVEKLTKIEEKIQDIKFQLFKSTAEVKAVDGLVFDEVEKILEILNKPKEDKTVHTM